MYVIKVESLHQQGYQVTILASKHGNKSSSDKQMLSLHAGLTFSVQKLLELKFKQLTAGKCCRLVQTKHSTEYSKNQKACVP